jgi:four helix bundle protein
MYPYRRLIVWQRAHELAVAIRAEFARCSAPDIAGQVQRASASIPTNIVEGAGSQTNGQFIRYLGIALASAQETEYLLLLARDTGSLEVAAHGQLSGPCVEIQRMLGGLIAAIRRGTVAGAAAARGRPRRASPPAKVSNGTPGKEEEV